MLNLVEQAQLFEERYLVNNDNTFEALNAWIDDANKLCARYQTRLAKSESLTACLTKQLPKNLDDRRVVKFMDATYKSKYIKQALADIDDRMVRSAVQNSLDESLAQNKLVYKYFDLLSSGQRSKVRVLCNMIWSNLYSEEVNDA